jgi:hypothetical protein
MTDVSQLDRRFLGVVEVDSGTLLIGDPGYVLPSARDGKAGIDYQEVIDAPTTGLAVPFAKGLALLANVADDGPYFVYGEYDDGELIRICIHLDPIELDE